MRELDTAPPDPDLEDTSRQRGVTPKRQAIVDAGLSKSTAHRYEELDGTPDEQAGAAGSTPAVLARTPVRVDDPGFARGKFRATMLVDLDASH